MKIVYDVLRGPGIQHLKKDIPKTYARLDALSQKAKTLPIEATVRKSASIPVTSGASTFSYRPSIIQRAIAASR